VLVHYVPRPGEALRLHAAYERQNGWGRTGGFPLVNDPLVIALREWQHIHAPIEVHPDNDCASTGDFRESFLERAFLVREVTILRLSPLVLLGDDTAAELLDLVGVALLLATDSNSFKRRMATGRHLRADHAACSPGNGRNPIFARMLMTIVCSYGDERRVCSNVLVETRRVPPLWYSAVIDGSAMVRNPKDLRW
jgi:hypothetical protein